MPIAGTVADVSVMCMQDRRFENYGPRWLYSMNVQAGAMHERILMCSRWTAAVRLYACVYFAGTSATLVSVITMGMVVITEPCAADHMYI